MERLIIPPPFLAFAAQYEELTPCRVVLQEKGAYRVLFSNGEQAAEVSGKFRYEAATASDYPAVGDYVMAEPNPLGAAVIQRILPRTSVFLRRAAGTANGEQVVAANIDTVFLCISLNKDFNLRRLERYMTVAWDSGATPVIVLTKADLCQHLEERLSAILPAIPMGADILVTTALETDGYAKLTPYLSPGKTVAFVGSSGVGKSTLINRLLGEDILHTNGLRNDDKGRHTTTRRALFVLKNGAMVIDTPGMRELGIWDAEAGLSMAFSDVEALIGSCRFSNCTHTREPGCAIRAALEDGTLAMERWQSYKKLYTENALADNAASYLAAKERKMQEISKINKANRKK